MAFHVPLSTDHEGRGSKQAISAPVDATVLFLKEESSTSVFVLNPLANVLPYILSSVMAEYILVTKDFISVSEEKTYSGVNPDGGSTSRKSSQAVKESNKQAAMIEYIIFLFIILSF